MVRLGSCLLALTVATAVVGCAFIRTSPERPSRQLARQCAPTEGPLLQLSPHPLEPVSSAPADASLEGFSAEALRVAGAIGLRALLEQLVQVEGAAAQDLKSELQWMRLQYQVLGRVVLVGKEIDRAAAEVRCEHARIGEIADSLKKAQDVRSTTQTLASVIVQGAGAVLSGAFALADLTLGEGLSGVISGTIGAGLGSLALMQQVQHELKHPRNLLRQMWEGHDEPHIFPASVWSLLTVPRKGHESLRDQLLTQWRHEMEELKSSQLESKKALLFGDGGIYQSQELETRATMLETLVATLELLNQDLEILLREVFSRQPPVGASPSAR